jgi:hypothetical protein
MEPFISRWKDKKKIVIGIDCGATQSGVSYALLIPQGEPKIQNVHEWPGQESQNWQAKIPSIIWYDQNGTPQAFGGEARRIEIEGRAEEGWQLAKHFKLHLHPASMRDKEGIELDDLPSKVSVEKCYTDLFRYLYQHTISFFKSHEIHGDDIWEQAQSSIEFVIAHPNGWTPYEQSKLRQAAIDGGLIPSTEEGRARVHFVTEAEASVHFMMMNSDLTARLDPETEFVVCDAGGSTVDITLYKVIKTSPSLELKEGRGPACTQAGGIFVNQSAGKYFSSRLYSSQAGLDPEEAGEYLVEAMKVFEDRAKKEFKEADDGADILIKVASVNKRKPAAGIERGSLRVTRATMASFFQPWVRKIIKSIEEQIQGHNPDHLLLVGGFGESPYLRSQLETCPSFRNIPLTRSRESTAKAVAVGAVAWRIQRSVVARATRFALGIPLAVHYDPDNEDHQGREISDEFDGKWVRGAWHEIVLKDQVVHEKAEHRQTCGNSFPVEILQFPGPLLKHLLRKRALTVYAYTGEGKAPSFMYGKTDTGTLLPGFTSVCTIHADWSQTPPPFECALGPSGPFLVLSFDVLISFGKIEFEAAIAWKDDKDVEHRGRCELIPEKFR